MAAPPRIVKPCEGCGTSIETTPTGRWCEPCGKKAHQRARRAHHERNREELLERRRAYAKRNRAAIRKYRREHYEANREEEIRRAAETYAWIKSNPMLLEEQRRKWREAKRKLREDPERREALNAKSREYRARLRAERPEVYRQQLEDGRIRRRLKREEAGAELVMVSEERWKKNQGYSTRTEKRVSAAPIASLIAEWLSVGEEMGDGLGDHANLNSQTSLAVASGVSERRIGSLLRGEQDRLLIPTAERLCVALGVRLEDLYGDELDEMERAA